MCLSRHLPHITVFFITFFLLGPGYAEEEYSLPEEGYFSLPFTQQPGPLISLGQTIIEKDKHMAYSVASYLKQKTEHYTQLSNNFLYGLSDRSSIMITMPVGIEYSHPPDISSGLGDLSLQAERVLYETWDNKYFDMFTVVGGLSLPTGAPRKNPYVSLDAESYFGGVSFSRMSTQHTFFTSYGIVVTSPTPEIKRGSQYLYQYGFGTNIHSVPKEYIFSILGEINGVYTEKDRGMGFLNPDSGGNIVYFTPSLWLSGPNLSFQLGLSFPFIQSVNGEQNKVNYLFYLACGITF